MSDLEKSAQLNAEDIEISEEVAVDVEGAQAEQTAIGKGARKRKKAEDEQPKFKIWIKNAPPETEEDYVAKQEIYALVRTSNSLKLHSKILSIILAVLFCFVAGSYLIVSFTDIAPFKMSTTTHDHDYVEVPTRVEGNCKNKGYLEWVCLYPDCNAPRREYDTVYGAHQFNNSAVREYVDELGVKHRVYTCYVCNEYENDVVVEEDGNDNQ